MRIRGIIYQQICQLRWHLLACLGLIMALPIEEAAVSFKEGDGFYSSGMIIVSLMFAPLLTGLIACANVQGDFEEKRYIFWRSKPVNVKLFITLKFLTGLVASLIIIACPVIFGLVLGIFYQDYIEYETIQYLMPFPVLIAILMYSLCFGCNVLVRRTARAWLIGMLLGAFILVIPFILPLNYKDFVSDIMFGPWGYYPAIMLAASAAVFVFALYAAQRDWHLRTNLKGLLWAGTGLVFALMMLFNSQVANIKVLQEKEIDSNWRGRIDMDYAGDKVIFQGRRYVNINDNKISFSDIDGNTNSIEAPLTRMKGYRTDTYPRDGRLYKKTKSNLYSLAIDEYYRKEDKKNIYEKVYLRSNMPTGESWKQVDELDISDCLEDSTYPSIAMRLIGNTIIAFVDKSILIIDITDTGKLKLIGKKLNVFGYYHTRRKEFTIPLVPVEEIDIKERIKLSIDWNYDAYNMCKASIVDIHDDSISFFLVSDKDIARFNITGWDEENIYCKFVTSRPFTILECLTGSVYFNRAFVKSGKLYCYERNTLMVFDIRSDRGIRKLGHFVRMDYEIDDIAVLENGNILLSMYWSYNLRKNHNNNFKRYLCLLENPK